MAQVQQGFGPFPDDLSTPLASAPGRGCLNEPPTLSPDLRASATAHLTCLHVSTHMCPRLYVPDRTLPAHPGDTGFDPWSRKIPYAVGQLSHCTTTNEPDLWNPQAATSEPMSHSSRSPHTLEPVLHNKRSHHNDTPTHHNWRVLAPTLHN